MVRAEHVISLLTCSYAKLGGLNGVSGGSSKDTASASSNPQGCWDAGLSAIASQEDQFKDTLDEYYRQVKIDRFFEKVKDTGGDIQVLEKELGTLKDLTEIQLVEEAKEFEQVCERRLSECRQDEADVAQFIKDMRFVQEADEVIEEYPEIVEDSQP
jgi:hypothetical protein